MNNGVFNTLAFIVMAAITIAFTGAWFAPAIVLALALASLVVLSIVGGVVLAIFASPTTVTETKFKAFAKTASGQVLFAILDNATILLLVVLFPNALPLLAFDFAIVVTLTRLSITLLRLQLVDRKTVQA